MSVYFTNMFSCSCLVFLIFYRAPLSDGSKRLASLSRFLPRDGLSSLRSRFDDSKFTKALGRELKIQPGDTVVISLDYQSRTVRRPWHWFYAVTPHTVLKFMPTVDTFVQSVKPKIVNPAERYGKYMMMNRVKKEDHIGLVGSLVATLMAHHPEPLPFNPLFCSAKHYVEYLSLGAVTRGRWHQVMYNKVASFCPVRSPLRSDMIMQIFISRKFTLKPKVGGDILLTIADWPEDIKHLVSEYMTQKIKWWPKGK